MSAANSGAKDGGATPAPTPLEAPLAGGLVIEASAGTGKTFALTTVAARAVVEAALPIDRVLVVTFTVAAAGELRHRLRRTLAAAAAAQRDPGGDAQAAHLAERWQRTGLAADAVQARLNQALRDLDRANVMTIHGFCQRLLTDFAFDGDTPFGFVVGGDDAADVAAAVRDFWRSRLAAAPTPLLAHAAGAGFTIAELTQWAGRLHAKPGLEIRGATADAAALDAAVDGWQRAFGDVQAAWASHRDDFIAAIGKRRWRSNSQRKMTRLLSVFNRAFGGDSAGLVPLADAGYFGAAKLAGILLKNPPQTLPDSPLLPLFDALGDAGTALADQRDAWLRCQYADLLAAVRRTLRDNAWRERRLSFNALLTEAHRALAGASGDALAAQLRERFPLALIDEFQDTDGLQARIFERIYAEEAAHPAGEGSAAGEASGLVTVGDPKQSIYGFRGADVFAYLRTSRGVETASRLQLETNYRATPALVAAVNALFAGTTPFLLPELGFHPARARADASAMPALEVLSGGQPFQLRLLPAQDGDERRTKPQCETLAAEDAAAEIAALLLDGHATLGGRPVSGRDIAVLVRTRNQGAAMARALRAHGVQSVEADEASVFATAEAEQLHWLLAALAHQDDAATHETRQQLRTALSGDLFGLDLAALAALVDDDAVWAEWQQRAQAWAETWQRSGVAAMIREVLFGQEAAGAETLLRHPAGVRQLTNLLHLAELLQQAESAEHLSPVACADWLAARREAPPEEAALLRLESDEELVRIVTVHRSKGLEFPIVFCPFAWWRLRTPRGDPPTAEYHDPSKDDFPEVLDLAPSVVAHDRQRVEEYAEELRLFYVAVTRAQHRCVATWMQAPDAAAAPLAWLLHRHGEHTDPAAAMKATRHHVEQLGDAEWRTEARDFAAAADLDVVAPEAPSALSGEPPTAALPEQRAFAARAFERELRPVRQMTSYSALVADAGAATTPDEHMEVERADHDQRVVRLTDEEVAASPGEGFFAFPRGRSAGDCLHELFEQSALAPERSQSERALAKRGMDERWADVASAMVANARETPLAPASAGARSFRLADLKQPAAELEFHLPAAGLDRGRLGRCLAEAGYEDPFADLGNTLGDIHGYLHGYIDLVAEHAGRWYVVDYKSNHLGGSVAAYGPGAVAAAMQRGGYHLQYLLYLVALHRHLQLRLPGYRYDEHMGGAYYLFIRGMRPEQPGHSVWFDAPPRRCIEAIDACLAGEGAE